MNLHIVNIIDITLNLRNNTYEPYRKPDNPVYIIESCNHPSEKLSDLSSTKEIFQKATRIYSEALKKSGFNEPLVFTPKTNASDNTNRKQRKRKIIWFNPLFSLNVKTNIGRTFLKLLKQHFPNPSYSCMNKVINYLITQ